MANLDERGRHVFGAAVAEDGRLQLVSDILENGFRVLGPTVTVTAGIATAEAFGTARIIIFIAPSGLASLEAFGAPEVILGAYLTVAGISSAEAFGALCIRSAWVDTSDASDSWSGVTVASDSWLDASAASDTWTDIPCD